MASQSPLLFTASALATVGCGLIAGVFFAFSSFVMKALSRLAGAEGIRAMQQINLVVLNPVFLGVFMGTAVVSVAVIGLSLWHGQNPEHLWLITGSLLYIVGTFGVTIACNVPLNDVLSKVNPDDGDGHRVWADYLRRWTWWNHVRAAAGTAAMVAMIVGMSL